MLQHLRTSAWLILLIFASAPFLRANPATQKAQGVPEARPSADDAAQIRSFLSAAEDHAAHIDYDLNQVRARCRIALAQFASGDSKGAAATLAKAFNAMQARQSSGQIQMEGYLHIADVRIQIGDHAGARKAVDAALTSVPRFDIGSLKELAFSRLAILYHRLGDAAMTTLCFDNAISLSVEPNGLNDEGMRMFIAADMTAVGEVTQARELAAGFNDRLFRSLAFLDIVKHQIAAGDLPGARQTAKRIPIPSRKEQAMADIAIAEAKAGDLAAARKTAEETGRGLYGQMTQSQIAIAEAVAGDIAGALNRAARIDLSEEQAETYIGIADAQLKAKDAAGARKSLDAAKRDADAVGRLPWWEFTCETFRILGAAQSRAGDMAAAKASFAIASAAAAKGDSRHPLEAPKKWQMLTDLSQAQVAAGDFDAALATVQSIAGSGEEQAQAATALCVELIKQRKLDDTAALAAKFDSPMTKAYIFAAAAERLATKNAPATRPAKR